jgi:hypothetical protein
MASALDLSATAEVVERGRRPCCARKRSAGGVNVKCVEGWKVDEGTAKPPAMAKKAWTVDHVSNVGEALVSALPLQVKERLKVKFLQDRELSLDKL